MPIRITPNHITASGNISASGTIYAAGLDINGSADIESNLLGINSLTAGGISATSNLTSPLIRLGASPGAFAVLNNAQTDYLNVGTRDANGSEAVLNLNHIGDITATGSLFIGSGSNGGNISASGTGSFGEINLDDNKILKVGTGDDLQIYHDGSNSYVSDTGVGSLILKGTDLQLKSAGDEFFMYGAANGQVAIYHDGVKKFETGTTGIAVTGKIDASGHITADLPTSEGSAQSNGLFTLSGSQIFSSSAWTSGHILDGATSESLFVFQKA